MVALLLVLQFLPFSDGRLYCDQKWHPGITHYRFHAGTTEPSAHSLSLHLGFASEGASVFGALADFSFLLHFPEGGTITGPVFVHNPNLLGAFHHVTTT